MLSDAAWTRWCEDEREVPGVTFLGVQGGRKELWETWIVEAKNATHARAIAENIIGEEMAKIRWVGEEEENARVKYPPLAVRGWVP